MECVIGKCPGLAEPEAFMSTFSVDALKFAIVILPVRLRWDRLDDIPVLYDLIILHSDVNDFCEFDTEKVHQE